MAQATPSRNFAASASDGDTTVNANTIAPAATFQTIRRKTSVENLSCTCCAPVRIG